jgi:hypothetical protein
MTRTKIKVTILKTTGIIAISGSLVASVNITACYDIALCNLVEVDRRFRGAYCLHQQVDEGSILHMRLVFSKTVRNAFAEMVDIVNSWV